MNRLALCVLISFGLIVTSCGGDGADLTIQTEPTVQPAATETPEPTAALEPNPTPIPEPTEAPIVDIQLGENIVAAEGLWTMQLAQGWTADINELIIYGATGVDNEPWEFDFNNLSPVVTIENADGWQMEVFRETNFFTVPSTQAMIDGVIAASGLEIINETEVEIGGHLGTLLATNTDTFITVFEVEDQMFVISFTGQEMTEQISQELDAMLATAIINASTVSPIAHARNTHFFDESNVSDTLISIYVPANWIYNEEFQSYEDPADTEHRWLQAWVYPHTDLDTAITNEFDGFASTWFKNEPDPEFINLSNIPFVVYWDGPRTIATSALIMGSDGETATAVYASVAQDIVNFGGDDLLDEIISGIWAFQQSDAASNQLDVIEESAALAELFDLTPEVADCTLIKVMSDVAPDRIVELNNQAEPTVIEAALVINAQTSCGVNIFSFFSIDVLTALPVTLSATIEQTECILHTPAGGLIAALELTGAEITQEQEAFLAETHVQCS